MQYLYKDNENKIAAIIVAYNPDINLLLSNLKILENQVDSILIVNNSSTDLDLEENPKLVIINNNENLGIAKALNIGLEYCISNDYEYALMLDQDSTPHVDMVKNLVSGFSSKDTAMVVPKIDYLDTDYGSENKSNGDVEDVKFAITSGSLIKTDYVKNIGYHDEDLFIDSVDFDYCFKIRLKKYKITRVNKAILYQRLGELKERKFLFMRFYPTNHNYIRRYYAMRNRLYMWERYWKYDKKFVVKSFLRCVYELFEILIFDRDKTKKFKYIFKGILDFIHRKKGKIQ